VTRIGTGEGRGLFGLNPHGYEQVRPEYPEELYALLVKATAARGPILEVGAGTGIATRRLLDLDMGPVTAVEPDARFQPLLEALTAVHADRLRLVQSAFETAALTPESFDLIVVATAFHWLDPKRRVHRMRELLAPGGRVALFWHVFQDLDLPDPFHEATAELLGGLGSSPSGAPDELPFALRKAERQAEFEGAGFRMVNFAEVRWPLELDPAGVRQLYETFASVQALDTGERNTLLDELAGIARETVGGRVIRNMTSVGYLFELQ
jgi:SAM-dependent methyltransferase